MAVAAETTEIGTRENFAALLDEALGVASGSSGLEGTVVKGQVISIENDFALIDVGLKSEGRVPLKEFAAGGAGPEIHVGDIVEVFLERMEDKNGEASLSREKARREEAWTQLEKNFQATERVTGSIFGRVMWNSYWNWDPRETSIVLLLLVYGAYLGLRGAIDEPERRASLSAAYALIAFVTVPFLVFAVPRMYSSLHPDTLINARGKVEMSPDIRATFFASLAAFTALFFWMYDLDRKASRAEREAAELEAQEVFA
jgi:hypothetical protein